MSAITPYTNNALPTEGELNSYKIIAKVAASNPYWKKLGGGGNEESVIATIFSVMLMARELGISPIQAIAGGINNIQGKFEISARLMNQIIRRHGHKMRIIISTDQVCRILGQRKDTLEELEESFTFEEAVRAGLVKDGGGWKKWPKDMLFARCISRLARRLWADLIGGCYVEGELQETILAQPLSKGLDLPDENEMHAQDDGINLSDAIVLDLPQNIDQQLVEKFLEESAQLNNCPINTLKERAKNNMDKFLTVFNSWREKQQTMEVAV